MARRRGALLERLQPRADHPMVSSLEPGEHKANPLEHPIYNNDQCPLCRTDQCIIHDWGLKEPLSLDEVTMVPIDLIVVGEQMVRSELGDDDITEFAADIARRGLLHPIVLGRLPDGRYQLRAGGRRLQAHVRLGRSHIRASISSRVEKSIRGVALAENLIRKQMSLSEESEAVRHMHLDEELPVEEISTLTGKSRSWVLRRLMVHTLPGDLLTILLEGRLALGAIELIALLPSIGARAFLVQQAEQSRASISQVRQMVETMQATPDMEDAIAAGVAVAQHPELAPEIFIACHGCNQPTRPAELTTLRVCQTCLTTPSSAVKKST